MDKRGFFEGGNKEYIITDMLPKRELMNYLWNAQTVVKLNQFGFGDCWFTDRHTRRSVDSGERNVYVQDLDNEVTYSANRNYDGLAFELWQAHVGLGYHKVVSVYRGVRVEVTTVVPSEGRGYYRNVTVTNLTDSMRNLNIYVQSCPKPELSWHSAYGNAEWNDELCGIVYDHTGFDIASEYKKTFVLSDTKPCGFEVSKGRFCGTYSSFAAPQALSQGGLSSQGIDFEENYVAVLQYECKLSGGEQKSFGLFSGSAASLDDIAKEKQFYLTDRPLSAYLEEQRLINKSMEEVLTISVPDSNLTSQTNIWLKRQLSLGKTWGRLYGRGFRDVMQDIAAFVSFDTGLARERIVSALAHQYEDGNPIRMYEPDFLFPYNDGAVWIPAPILLYLKESGDTGILDEQVSYLKGDSHHETSYEDAFHFREYKGTDYRESVFEHIKKGMDYLCACKGSNGLVLFRGGDWNDSLNNAGREGRGESVWLSIASVKAIKEFIEIARIYKAEDLVDYYQARAEEFCQAILAVGVDGDHYIYGINDFGDKIGSKDSKGPDIFLNPQTWAVLAGIDGYENLVKAMDKVEARLKCDFGYVQCAPSYKEGDNTIGRLSYFKPGLVENGAVYNHGVAFKIVADCMLGRGDLAYESFKRISFDNPLNPDSGMEPYAVSNMLIGPENQYQAGYAPMSWITGTAGWLYRCVSEYMLGIKPEMDGMRIEPCLPSHWKNVSARRKFRGAIYNIQYVKSGTCEVLLNGEALDSNVIPLNKARAINQVVVNY